MLTPCVILFSTHDTFLLDVNLRCIDMQYYEAMYQYLINLDLYQIVDILQTEKDIINAFLIAGLVER